MSQIGAAAVYFLQCILVRKKTGATASLLRTAELLGFRKKHFISKGLWKMQALFYAKNTPIFRIGDGANEALAGRVAVAQSKKKAPPKIRRGQEA
ncbi:MAG: hypothetical protein RQ754_12955 [Desulfuromonadales bacterium]|nr:hypothetical protein [Desulfuromonadales bacterium]